MTINITIYDFWDLRKAANPEFLIDPIHQEDYLCRYPKELGSGYYRWIPLRDGILIEIIETYLPQLIKWITHAHQNGLEFAFMLAGSWQDFDGQTTKSGENYIFSGVYPQSNNSVNGAGNLRWVSLIIKPETLLTLLESYGEQVPKDLENAIALPSRAIPLLFLPMSELMLQSTTNMIIGGRRSTLRISLMSNISTRMATLPSLKHR